MIRIFTVALAVSMLSLPASADKIATVQDIHGATNAADNRNFQCVTGCQTAKAECQGNAGLRVNPQSVRRNAGCMNAYMQCMRTCTQELADTLSGIPTKF